MFHEVAARPEYVALENEVLQLWQAERVFERLRAQTRGGPKWSFLDGPITANNPMGVHHAWGRTYKDVYNRYHAMLGHELRWQQGFDCQGLWVEVEVEKALGFRSKREIEAFGVGNFVNACKERVQRFAAVQTEQSKRLGYWMDWENSYYTLSDENNYSIWGFLKLCHERGWLYRGHDVLPWCPRCGSALSEHEIATEGYAEKTHLALTVAFPLLDRPGEALLAWTTTPWTLPANVAAAVHPELTYVRVERTTDDRQQTSDSLTSYWLEKSAFERPPDSSFVLRLSSFVLREERTGSELVGWRYQGPFDELEAQQGVEHRVVAWREVSAGEGTGVVHVAPGAGKEDHALGRELDLAVLAPLDDAGVYLVGYGWLTGQRAADVPEQVAETLERKGLLFARELYSHRYPVCWRCGTELVFRLVDEWLISMDELRGQMMDAAREATWLPGFGLERELDWLRNMDDWMISKKRYWGLALPFYPCEACGHLTVVGSDDELRQRAVQGWEQFAGHSPHRPWLDAVKVACEQCGQPVARVPDVGNVWLDAGIVAFSTLNYRHDRDYWREWFPAHLVVESFPGQFRNWFYALLAMSTALEGVSPFRTLLGHATVDDERGEAMHKSKGNSIPFEVAADWHGVEPLRWLFASAPLERNLHFGQRLAEETARSLQPLWEVYRFFVTYATLDGWPAMQNAECRMQNTAGAAMQNAECRMQNTSDLALKMPWCLEASSSALGVGGSAFSVHRSALDRWLLARLNQLVALAGTRLGSYDLRGFTEAVEAFLDDLSNWYVRRSRRRFWGAGSAEQAPYAALYTTLVTLARLLAPVLPFLSEALYQNLVRSVQPDAPVSVHLTGYPQQCGNEGQTTAETAELLHSDSSILPAMAVARRVVALGRAARKAAGVRVRQPLGRMLVLTSNVEERAALERLQHEVLEELNVKALELLDAGAVLQSYRLKPNLRLLGPRLGRTLPQVRAALEGLSPQAAAELARALEVNQSVELVLGSERVMLAPSEVLVEQVALEGYAVAQEGGLQVALDTHLDDALRHEGLARDLVRAVQEARKQAGLALSDRVTLYLEPLNGAAIALEPLLVQWGAYLRSETLADELLLQIPASGVATHTLEFEGMELRLAVLRQFATEFTEHTER